MSKPIGGLRWGTGMRVIVSCSVESEGQDKGGRKVSSPLKVRRSSFRALSHNEGPAKESLQAYDRLLFVFIMSTLLTLSQESRDITLNSVD